mmetsp:Transcript_3457/g.7805  ORF Transcript_3457/g.7805 Transcript_3457/m.7805 type:complete len:225 (-) Transcript_3457:552-1226(-)
MTTFLPRSVPGYSNQVELLFLGWPTFSCPMGVPVETERRQHLSGWITLSRVLVRYPMGWRRPANRIGFDLVVCLSNRRHPWLIVNGFLLRLRNVRHLLMRKCLPSLVWRSPRFRSGNVLRRSHGQTQRVWDKNLATRKVMLPVWLQWTTQSVWMKSRTLMKVAELAERRQQIPGRWPKLLMRPSLSTLLCVLRLRVAPTQPRSRRILECTIPKLHLLTSSWLAI